MNIDSIENGIVIDHIQAKKGMEIYEALNLKELNCLVAIITNAKSQKMGRKDMIKIDKELQVNMDMIGYLAPNATINKVVNGQLIEKYQVKLPEEIVNLAKCHNPRCITSAEKDLDQIFLLTDKEKQVYRCKYCETSLK